MRKCVDCGCTEARACVRGGVPCCWSFTLGKRCGVCSYCNEKRVLRIRECRRKRARVRAAL